MPPPDLLDSIGALRCGPGGREPVHSAPMVRIEQFEDETLGGEVFYRAVWRLTGRTGGWMRTETKALKMLLLALAEHPEEARGLINREVVLSADSAQAAPSADVTKRSQAVTVPFKRPRGDPGAAPSKPSGTKAGR